MVDFKNYLTATTLILEHIIPYGKVEFFAPPWIALFLFPFAILPQTLSTVLWLFGSLVSVASCALLATPKNHIYPVIALIAPPTLLNLAVGQISAFVSLACTILLLEVSGKRRLWLLFLCLFIASAKPNLAAIPTLIALITLLRTKDFRKLIILGVTFILLTIISELLFPNIINEWILAMVSGSYSYGAPAPLQITIMNGITLPIGSSYYHGAPFLISLPIIAWFVYLYYREGLTTRNIALSLSLGFLFLPYYRLYDLIILTYPIGQIVSGFLGQANPSPSTTKIDAIFRPEKSCHKRPNK